MASLDDFTDERFVGISEKVIGQSVKGKGIKFTGYIRGRAIGIEGKKVVVDAGSKYNHLILYDPEDLDLEIMQKPRTMAVAEEIDLSKKKKAYSGEK